jgi:hypothetical protein
LFDSPCKLFGPSSGGVWTPHIDPLCTW